VTLNTMHDTKNREWQLLSIIETEGDNLILYITQVKIYTDFFA